MSSPFYSKISRVSRVRSIMDMGTSDEKRIGEVPTLYYRPFVPDIHGVSGGFAPLFGRYCSKDERFQH